MYRNNPFHHSKVGVTLSATALLRRTYTGANICAAVAAPTSLRSVETKFPGGGLEFGEGTRDCLKREFKEEMDLDVEVTGHLYTTDFFQMSAFNPEHQIISIYYFVRALEPIKAPLRDKPFDFDERELKIYAEKKECETFRFINWEEFSAESITLPIDKVVAKLVRENY